MTLQFFTPEFNKSSHYIEWTTLVHERIIFDQYLGQSIRQWPKKSYVIIQSLKFGRPMISKTFKMTEKVISWQLKKYIYKGCFFVCYLDKIRMWFSRTHWILNHCLRRLRVCRHVRMTWGAIICITPVTTGSWVRWVATSIPICWVVIPGPLVSVIAIRWKAMCWICWNKKWRTGS